MVLLADYTITDLLEQSGARPRGNKRFDCPDCGSRRTVRVNEAKQAFLCFHAGCSFRGYRTTLEKRLGIYRRLPSAEYQELRQEQERVREVARRLYTAAHKRQLELRELLRELGRLEIAAHDAGPTDEAWQILSAVYTNRPAIEQELDALESADPVIVFASLRQLPTRAA